MKYELACLLLICLTKIHYAQSSILVNATQATISTFLYSRPHTIPLDNDQFIMLADDFNAYLNVYVYDRYSLVRNFPININTGAHYGRVARINSTYIAAVWELSSQNARRICPITGCTGETSEFPVDTNNASPSLPKIATLGNATSYGGKFIVCWIESSSFYIRVFTNEGTPIHAPQQLTSTFWYSGDVTSVWNGVEWNWIAAYDDNSGFPRFRIVYANGTYDSYINIGSYGAYISISSTYGDTKWGAIWQDVNANMSVKFFYPNGAIFSSATTVDFSTPGPKNAGYLGPMPGGRYVVGWVDYGANSTTLNVFGNIVYPNATRVYSDNLQFADTLTNSQQFIALTGFPSGSSPDQYVAYWFDSGTPTFKVVNLATPSPSATPSATPSVTPSATPSNSPSSSSTPSITPSTSISPSTTPTPSVTPSTSISPSTTPTPSVTPSSSHSPSKSPVAASPSATRTPTPTLTPSTTPSRTSSPSQSASASPTPSAEAKSHASKINTAMLAGIIGGAGGLAALGFCIAAFVVLRKRKQQDNNDQEPTTAVELQPSSPPSSSTTPKPKPTLASLENDKGWKINMKDIEMKKELGRGAFGVVYKCMWRNTDCVIKLLNVNQSNEVAINAFIREAHNVKNVRNHPNVCGILGVCTDPVGIVMEYVAGGSLLHCIANKKVVMTTMKVIQFAKDIASGMSHLHAENIIHLDLACRNLLVTTVNNEDHIKITDFGLSRIIDAESYTASSDSTFPLRWTAPETLSMRLVSRASDVWSYAVTLWEMIERKIPYMDLPSNEVLDFILSGNRLPRPTKVEIPDALWGLMMRCWNEAPAERPTFAEICSELRIIEQENGNNNGQSLTNSDFLIPGASEPPQNTSPSREQLSTQNTDYSSYKKVGSQSSSSSQQQRTGPSQTFSTESGSASANISTERSVAGTTANTSANEQMINDIGSKESAYGNKTK